MKGRGDTFGALQVQRVKTQSVFAGDGGLDSQLTGRTGPNCTSNKRTACLELGLAVFAFEKKQICACSTAGFE